MKVQNRITPAVITAATSLLQPYCPELNPNNLILALKAWGEETREPKPKNPEIEKPLTRFEVANLLGVSLPTVNRMMNDGRLQKIKLTPHGAARISSASVRAIISGPQTQEQPMESAEVY
jgi:excisionase family DNA binding protein